MVDVAEPQLEGPPTRRILRWWTDYGPMMAVSLSTVVALAGIFVGAGIAMRSTENSIRAENERQAVALAEQRGGEARELRRVTYKAFADAANNYAVVQTERATCSPGTDLPTGQGVICGASFELLKSARYAFQDGVNSIYTLGSPEALRATERIARLLPKANVGQGQPVESSYDEAAFSAAYSAFLRVMNCDTNPTPREDCRS